MNPTTEQLLQLASFADTLSAILLLVMALTPFALGLYTAHLKRAGHI